MLTFLSQNLATILISVGLLAVVALIVAKMARDRRAGKTSCGCGCSGCALQGQCHKQAP